MKRRFDEKARRLPSRGMAIAAAALVVALTGGAWAAIPDSDGVIHGCYGKSGGLRVIDDIDNACGKNETPLDWSQSGPQGVAGPAGPSGVQGPAGSSGLIGLETVHEEAHFDGSEGGAVIAQCPAGKVTTGGGGYIGHVFGEDVPRAYLTASYPITDGWYLEAGQPPSSSAPFDLVVYALCANDAS